MENVWVIAAIWVGLALIATLLAIWLKISTALTEIVVGTVVPLAIGAIAGSVSLGAKSDWVTFLAGTGAIVLTFLAGAELDPQIFRTEWRVAGVVGLVGFFAPFLGCSALSYYLLHWSPRASLLAGVALSTTSVAVVYAVMLELGFNTTEFGKAILAACFVNDLGTRGKYPRRSDCAWTTRNFALLATDPRVCIGAGVALRTLSCLGD